MTSTTTDRINGINGGIAIKAPCRVATTANITLSGEQTIDGVAVVSGDRVLVKDQTSGVNNGIYIASTSAWQRDLDFNGINDVVTGTVVYVVSGTTNANSAWQISTTGEIVPGTTSIAFTESANLSSASAFMLTVLNDVDAATARTTLGALASDISTLTAETTPAADDLLAVYDTSAATTDKMTLENTMKVVNVLTEDTTPAGATDFVLTYDTSASSAKKVKPTNLLKSINDLGTVTIDAAADYVPFYDTSGAVAGKTLASALSGARLLGSASYATNTSLATTIPGDDTIPQNTEGTEIMSVAVTPTDASKTLIITFGGMASSATSGDIGAAALFVDSTANALYTAANSFVSNGNLYQIQGQYSLSAGSTSARTYKLRVGTSSGAFYPNGTGAATRKYGGNAAWTMFVYEI